MPARAVVEEFFSGDPVYLNPFSYTLHNLHDTVQNHRERLGFVHEFHDGAGSRGQ